MKQETRNREWVLVVIVITIMAAFSVKVFAGVTNVVTLTWDHDTVRTNFNVYYGSTLVGQAIVPTAVTNVRTNQVTFALTNSTTFFAVTAIDTNGLESDFSNVLTVSRPAVGTNLRILGVTNFLFGPFLP